MVATGVRQGTILAGALLLAGAACAAPASARPAGNCDSRLSAQVAEARPGFRLLSVDLHPAGLVVPDSRTSSPPLPAHCEVTGIMHERKGIDGQDYAIRFRMRLPLDWNRRFLFQGGGGANGDTGSAIGPIGHGSAPALLRGFAVVSQDSGHNNAINTRPGQGGELAFGRDPQARLDYGYASLKPVYDAARTMIRLFYRATPERSYFAGCSKGGQEGVQFAARYPKAFDGILACAPGISLARAAFGAAGQIQAFGRAIDAPQGTPVTLLGLAHAFSDADLAVARDAILAACDADDGLADGAVNNFTACTTEKVLPQLQARQCRPGQTSGCLRSAQVAALRQSFEGPRDGQGRPVYASFPWDGGLADNGWRIWHLGIAGPDGTVAAPPVDATLIAPAMATLYSTPPKVLPDDPQALVDYQMGIDYRRDLSTIFATDDRFTTSSWEMGQARKADLSAFRAARGKLMIVQGVSDPIFSIDDTIAWIGDVAKATGGDVRSFLRLFAVPGMVHCEGGLATDQYDPLAALVGWVEKGKAPDRLEAHAKAGSAWQDRTRPLCAFPAYARYTGGDIHDAASFACTLPQAPKT